MTTCVSLRFVFIVSALGSLHRSFVSLFACVCVWSLLCNLNLHRSSLNKLPSRIAFSEQTRFVRRHLFLSLTQSLKLRYTTNRLPIHLSALAPHLPFFRSISILHSLEAVDVCVFRFNLLASTWLPSTLFVWCFHLNTFPFQTWLAFRLDVILPLL